MPTVYRNSDQRTPLGKSRRPALLSYSPETYISAGATTGILAHLALRYLFRTPQLGWQMPLFMTLCLGGLPLILQLTRRQSFFRRRGGVVSHQVEGGQHDQGEHGGGHQSSDDHGGKRSLHFGANAVRDSDRQQSEHGQRRRHQNGPKARLGALGDSIIRGSAFPLKLSEVADLTTPF